MKKFKIGEFPLILMGVTLIALAFVHYTAPDDSDRHPLSKDKSYELHLQKLKIDAMSRLRPKENVFVRVTFDQKDVLEFGREENWAIDYKTVIDIDQKIHIDPNWIEDDLMEYKVELVQEYNVLDQHKVEITLVRCATVSKEVSVYNRSYQCFIPGEKTPLFTYRLAEEGVPPPGQQMRDVAAETTTASIK